MFYEPQALIVVYKDELLANQLKKLVETKDDIDEEQTVGTTDGSIKVVTWMEKMWLEQKKQGNLNSKVLFLGDIKGTDKLIPIIDVKYDDFGVCYGWAGNQAIVWANPKALKEEELRKFNEEFSALPVPASLKNEAKEIAVTDEPEERGAKKIWNNISVFASKTAGGIKDVLTNYSSIRRQQLLFGIIKMYQQDLEKFMLS